MRTRESALPLSAPQARDRRRRLLVEIARIDAQLADEKRQGNWKWQERALDKRDRFRSEARLLTEKLLGDAEKLLVETRDILRAMSKEVDFEPAEQLLLDQIEEFFKNEEGAKGG